MAKLTEEQKEFIVTRHALYDPIKVIREAFNEQYGVMLTAQQVDDYNPGGRRRHKAPGRHSKGIAARLTTLYDLTRKRFHEEIADIPIATRAYRLQAMQRLFDEAEGKRNVRMAMELLERAAKETGDAYTNRHKVEHSGSVLGTALDALDG